jgi:hypothetical protein
MWKSLRTTMAGQLLLLVVLGGTLFYCRGAVLSELVALSGAYWTGVPTSVGAAELDLSTGKLRLTRLRLANPEGFESFQFASVQEARLSFDPASLPLHTIEIKRLALNGVVLHVELSDQHSNVGAILAHLDQVDSKRNSKDQGKKVVVRQLAVTNGRAQIAYAPALSERGVLNVKLKDLVFSDIGTKTHGITPAALAHRIIDQIVSRALLVAARTTGSVPRSRQRELHNRVEQASR